MLLESIILAACLEGSGCSESMNAYYRSKPGLEEVVKITERRVINAVGADTARYLFPLIVLGVSQEASFKLNQRWSIKGNRNEASLILVWSLE